VSPLRSPRHIPGMNTRPARSAAASGFEALSRDLKQEFQAWRGETWSDRKFDRLARRLFEFQFTHCAPYRSYCVARRTDPGTIRDWREIPPVPAEAFRHVDLVCLRTEAELEFRTSGTSRGRELRGVHTVPDPTLYRASLRPAFRHLALGIDGEPDAPRIVSLVPPFDAAAASSLAWMIDDLILAYGGAGSGSVASPRGIDWDSLAGLCRLAESDGGPGSERTTDGPYLLGTTLAFAAWLDVLEGQDARFALPSSTLLMDTGGAKGREGLDRAAIFGRLLPRLGLEESRVINEFGMTELLSQRYGRGTGVEPLFAPPWLRSLVLDPVSLEPRGDGEEGILCHFDLANAGSVTAVLTEDRGRAERGGIVLLGRTPGAPPRGCSLSTAELLRAAG
jgi:hypothetical protein